MHVWLVRHALAADREKFDGPDADRPLTDKGRRRFRRFCRWLLDQTAAPDLILTSPLLRAHQTAEILARASGLRKSEILVTNRLAPAGDAKELLTQLVQQPSERVALVGHEPDLSQTLALLLGGVSVQFGKGFIASVDLPVGTPVGSGQLLWFIGPKFV
ncbi:MAG: phosphohistidine phosphatase SixA [Planctomycetes bacterium]|nr:phosphohistidine phosphatase SixA [Planctomycetota bacterium]